MLKLPKDLSALAVHSYFSLMRGTRSVEELCHAARKLGYTHLALTDTNNLYGLPAFLKHCARTGSRPSWARK